MRGATQLLHRPFVKAFSVLVQMVVPKTGHFLIEATASRLQAVTHSRTHSLAERNRSLEDLEVHAVGQKNQPKRQHDMDLPL
jgi:hypothetical protein